MQKYMNNAAWNSGFEYEIIIFIMFNCSLEIIKYVNYHWRWIIYLAVPISHTMITSQRDTINKNTAEW